jgi:6-phosphogluconate dehydrogenase
MWNYVTVYNEDEGNLQVRKKQQKKRKTIQPTKRVSEFHIELRHPRLHLDGS